MFASLAIALRYAAVRRQFATIDKSREERQILDYQTLQHILVPELSKAFVQSTVARYIRDSFREMMKGIENFNFSAMDSMHHILSGFKAKFSDEACFSIDKCRRSTGGAGFASHSGFSDIYYNTSPQPTFEGDNTVLLLQATKFVFKLVKQAKKDPSKTLPFPFSYISEIDKLLSISGKGKSVDEVMDLDVLSGALAVRAAYLIKNTVQAVSESHEPERIKDNELFAQMKIDMVKAHVNHLTFTVYRQQVESQAWKDSRIKPLLLELGRIWAINSIMENVGPIFDAGYFAPSVSMRMNEALDIMVRKLRPQLIPLVELKAASDLVVPTNIGNSYGDIYETQLEWAKDSSMNHYDKDGVPPQWEEYIKPFLHDEPPVKHPKNLPKTVLAKL